MIRDETHQGATGRGDGICDTQGSHDFTTAWKPSRLPASIVGFCGDTEVPLVKTPCCQQWIYCDTAFVSFRGGGRCQVEHERFSCVILTMRVGMGTVGKLPEMPGFTGSHEITNLRREPHQLAEILKILRHGRRS